MNCNRFLKQEIVIAVRLFEGDLMCRQNKSIMNILGIKKMIIQDKRIFIFEEHHHVLYPWALIKREKRNSELNLFSFDYHTDTCNPFQYYAYYHKLGKNKVDEMINSIKYDKDNTINEAIEFLRHDEHILTAIRSGILNHAFIIAQNQTGDVPESNEEKERLDNLWTADSIKNRILGKEVITPREKRTYPYSDIYLPDFWYNGCDHENYDQFLEDSFLQVHFETLSRMSNLVKSDGTIESDYILDIDLDYFMTPNSICPSENKIFSKLVKNAVAITIAKESECVDMCSKGKNTADDLLKKLLLLIQNILSDGE